MLSSVIRYRNEDDVCGWIAWGPVSIIMRIHDMKRCGIFIFYSMFSTISSGLPMINGLLVPPRNLVASNDGTLNIPVDSIRDISEHDIYPGPLADASLSPFNRLKVRRL